MSEALLFYLVAEFGGEGGLARLGLTLADIPVINDMIRGKVGGCVSQLHSFPGTLTCIGCSSYIGPLSLCLSCPQLSRLVQGPS